jgi:hypothetical protein
MPPRRRPQSFRGLVRENLTHIEHELERGIDRQSLLLELGIDTVTAKVFRNALYHARRRARNRPRRSSVATRLASTVNPATVSAPQASALPPSSAAPKRASKMNDSVPNPNPAATMQTPRDFLDLVRNTDDRDIF